VSLLIGILIGLVLGLTGAGGSVFAVPMLVLLLGLPVNEAIGFALGAVAVSALYGTLKNWRYKTVLWLPAAILTVSGVLLVSAGKALGNQLPEALLVVGFSLLAIVIALRMWRQAIRQPESSQVVRSGQIDPQLLTRPVCRVSPTGQFKWRLPCVGSLVISGLLVGLLTGLFGVGGGFLIVPLVLFLTQVSMQQAVGTSLFIITWVSGTGFINYALTSDQLDWSMLALISAGGVAGMFLGSRIAHKIAGPQLQRIFAMGLVVVSLLMLINQILFG